jgi:hypothetical protein
MLSFSFIKYLTISLESQVAKPTEIYTHVMARGIGQLQSPFDRMG